MAPTAAWRQRYVVGPIPSFASVEFQRLSCLQSASRTNSSETFRNSAAAPVSGGYRPIQHNPGGIFLEGVFIAARQDWFHRFQQDLVRHASFVGSLGVSCLDIDVHLTANYLIVLAVSS